MRLPDAGKQTVGRLPRVVLVAPQFMAQRSVFEGGTRPIDKLLYTYVTMISEPGSTCLREDQIIEAGRRSDQATRKHEQALDVCPIAIEVGGFKPESYLSRAQTYVMLGKKRRAIAALDRGLRVEPEDPRLLKARAVFGWRKPRIVSALARGHVVNRVLGRLRTLASAKIPRGAQSEILAPSAS